MCECVFSSTQLISCKYILSSDSSWCFSNTPKTLSHWVTRGKSSCCDLDPPVESLETEQTIGNRLAKKWLSHHQDSPFSPDVPFGMLTLPSGETQNTGTTFGKGRLFSRILCRWLDSNELEFTPFFSQRVLIGLIFRLFSMKQTFQDRSQSRVVP